MLDNIYFFDLSVPLQKRNRNKLRSRNLRTIAVPFFLKSRPLIGLFFFYWFFVFSNPRFVVGGVAGGLGFRIK